MITKENVIQTLKDYRTPYWNLYSKKFENAKDKEGKAFFKPDPTLNDDANIEKSVERLESAFLLFKNDNSPVYEIVMKPNEKSSGGAVLTLEFKINENAVPESKTDGLNGINNISNLGNMANLGFVHIGMLEVEKERRLLLEEKFDQKLTLRLKEEELRKKAEDLKEKETYFNSGAQKWGKGLEYAAEKLFTKFFPEEAGSTISGPATVETKEITDNTNDTPARKVIERLSEYLDENIKDENKLLKIELFTQKLVEKINNPEKTENNGIFKDHNEPSGSEDNANTEAE
jgi:hypothetical protein